MSQPPTVYQNAGQIAPGAPSSASREPILDAEPPPPPETLTASDVSELWVRMTRLYGHRWTSSFGESDDGTWLACLQGLYPFELARGIRYLIRAGAAWPPTGPEFRDQCLGIAMMLGELVEAALREDPAWLPSLLANRISSWDRGHTPIFELRRVYQALAPGVLREAREGLMAEGLGRLPRAYRQQLERDGGPELGRLIDAQ